MADEWQRKRSAWLHEHRATSYADLAIEFHLNYHRHFTDTFHQLLDAGHGACHLANREIADVLIHKVIEGHGTCFNLEAWCVMPNHFHAIIEPAKGSVLGDIVQHWKGGSAFAINRVLGRRGAFWQKEPFDHIVRSEPQWKRLCLYIADNPAQAHLSEGFVLGFGADVGLSRNDVVSRIEAHGGAGDRER